LRLNLLCPLDAGLRAGREAESARAKAAGITGFAQANAFKRAEELEEEAVAAVLDAAEVVTCTCVGAGGRALAERSFAVVVLDEATQATEPDCLVTILKVRRVAV